MVGVGWGSALKPANEPIVLARKPLEKGLSIAENVLRWGTGAINIDGCRIGFKNEADYKESTQKNQHADFGTKPLTNNIIYGDYSMVQPKNYQPEGRFPANLILTHHPECECVGTKKVGSSKEGEYNYKGNEYDVEGFVPKNSPEANSNYGQETIEDWNCHPDCPIKILDNQSGESKSSNTKRNRSTIGSFGMPNDNTPEYSDKGGASRFFQQCNFEQNVRFQYIAKASKSERNKGLEGFEEKTSGSLNFRNPSSSGRSEDAPSVVAMGGITKPKMNFHPTVKPIKLMQYLVRLITPPNGKVLDPFCGSGTTGIACKLEGYEFVGIEQDAEYCKIAEARINGYKPEIEDSKEIEQEPQPQEKFTQLSLF